MKYIFHEGELIGEYPIESIQTCLYDGTDMMNDMCFDEDFMAPENFTYSDLTYVETEEEQFEKKDHSRVFLHMKDGSIHELELRKLSQEEFTECSYYYGGRRKNRSLSVSEQCEKISTALQREIDYLESLPPEKAKAYAKNSLMRVGIIDENGDLTEQYGGNAASDVNKCDKERENEQIIRAVMA